MGEEGECVCVCVWGGAGGVPREMNAKNTHTTFAQGIPPPPESFSFSSAVTFCPDVSLKSVTGSGGAISTALCLQVEHEGRRQGAVGE